MHATVARGDWVQPWTEWLHRGGVLSRLSAAKAIPTLTTAVKVLAATLPGTRAPVGIAKLVIETTGDAHGLDDGTPAAALILRALSAALDEPPPATAADRRLLWQRVAVSTDEISGTVITWGLLGCLRCGRRGMTGWPDNLVDGVSRSEGIFRLLSPPSCCAGCERE